jgi:predicted secreted protein
MKNFILVLLTMISTLAFAREHQMIDTLGSSSKGQFVALEEYGYEHQKHSYFVRINVINVWTSEYVGRSINVELPALKSTDLQKARDRAKILAQDELNRFGIRG